MAYELACRSTQPVSTSDSHWLWMHSGFLALWMLLMLLGTLAIGIYLGWRLHQACCAPRAPSAPGISVASQAPTTYTALRKVEGQPRFQPLAEHAWG